MKAILKSIMIIVLLVSVSYQSSAQYQEKTSNRLNSLYQLKLDKYTKMNKTGLYILGGGAALTTLGIVSLAQVEYEEDSANPGTYEPDNPGQFVAGLFSTLAGIGMTATGTTLAIIGNYKKKSYQRKLDNLSVSYLNRHGASGLRLTYSF